MPTSPQEQPSDQDDPSAPSDLRESETISWKRPSVLALGAGAVLAAGIVLGYLASQGAPAGRETGATSTGAAGAQPAASTAPIWAAGGLSLITLENGGVVDAETTKWHDEVAPKIGIALSLFNRPINQTAGELTRMCYSVKLTGEGLAQSSKAPKPEVEKSFRRWIDELRQAGESCQDRRDEETDEAFVARATAALAATQLPFEEMVVTLDPYIDFNALPQTDMAPSAPTP